MADPVEVEFQESGEAALTAALERLTASASELAQALGDVTAAADEMGGANDEVTESGDELAAATDSVSTSAGAATLATGALAAAAAAAAAAYLAWTEVIVPFGDELERQLGILNRTEGSVGAASQAVGGMVSNLDLVIARNRLLQAGLRLSNEDFAAVAEVAFDFAAATGGDATQAMEQLGNALVTGRTQGLMRFGLELDSTRTESERMADALAQLRERAAGMESGADTLGGQLGRLDVMVENATTEFLSAFDATSGLGQAFDELGVEVQSAADALGIRLPSAMAIVRASGASLAAVLETIVERVTVTIQSFRALFEAIRTRDFEAATDALSNLGDVINPLEFHTDLLANATEGFRAATERAEASTGDLATQITRSTRAHQSATDAAREHREALVALGAEIANDNFLSLEETIAQEEAQLLNEREVTFNDALKAREAAQHQSDIRRLAQQERESERMAEAQRELVESAREASTDFANAWENGVDGVINALERANEAAREAGTAMVSSLDAAGSAAAAAATNIGESLLGGIANSFAGAAKAAIKGEQAFGDALAGMLEDTLFSIGTQAVVLSVFEFAKAIAEAASLNAPGAAAHAAAGAAYAAVAALAFAGGAAAASASPSTATSAPATSAPAAPEGSPSGGGSRGDSVTVVFTGTVVTAGTRAEVGRELEDLLAAGNRRFGRAA